MRNDYLDPAYLRLGTERQRQAYSALEEVEVLKKLNLYKPVLVGTIPLNIDINTSDLDIICHASDLGQFKVDLKNYFGIFGEFQCHSEHLNSIETVICTFTNASFPFEIFAQDRPVTEQEGYVHLLVEAALLELGGPTAVREIRKLKEKGLKTEPAFATYFKIVGDPYQQLLALKGLTGATLRARLLDLQI